MTTQRRNTLFIALAVGAVLLAWGGYRLSKKAAPEAYEAISPGAGRFDPDHEEGAVQYSDLDKVAGPLPTNHRTYRMAALMKFFGNQYWQWLAEGMRAHAREVNVELDVQAAATESDAAGQAQLMDIMVDKRYDAILISPQTDKNLGEPVERARKAGILVLNVNDAVLEGAAHWVGPNQYENGVHAAKHLMNRFPQGGEVAVIKGLAGVYAVNERTQGFADTLRGSPITIAAMAHGNWDLQQALEAASVILRDHPDLLAFYCNNDIMALGVVESVRSAGKKDRVLVIGTDGIGPAHDAIRGGDLTATVDSFPRGTGKAAIDVALRLLEGQRVPRAVYSPQALITRDNIATLIPTAK